MIKATANISLLAHHRPSRKGGEPLAVRLPPKRGLEGGLHLWLYVFPPRGDMRGALFFTIFSQHLLNHFGKMLLFQHMHLGGNVVRGVGGLEWRLELGDDFATVADF